MAQQSHDIETGIEYESDVPTAADLYAYIDGGEFAKVVALNRIDDESVDELVYWCEAGHCEAEEQIYQTKIDADTSLEEFVREVVLVDPKVEIEVTRAHFEEDN